MDPYILWMDPYILWSLGTSFFHLAQCFQNSSKVQPVISTSFLLKAEYYLIVWTEYTLCIHVLMDVSVVTTCMFSHFLLSENFLCASLHSWLADRSHGPGRGKNCSHFTIRGTGSQELRDQLKDPSQSYPRELKLVAWGSYRTHCVWFGLKSISQLY